MKTSVIPWTNKGETESLLPKAKEPSRAAGDQTTVTRPRPSALPGLAKPDSEKSSSTVLDLGCL
jgi:hypothetical protein